MKKYVIQFDFSLFGLEIYVFVLLKYEVNVCGNEWLNMCYIFW